MHIDIPERLAHTLARDRELQGVVHLSLERFTRWIGHSGVPFFREYTDHGPTHISDVLESSVQLISGPAWQVLSAGDAAVLILASLLHDAALHLQEDGFLSLVHTKKTPDRIHELDRHDWNVLWDQFVSEANRFSQRELTALFGKPDPVHPPNLRTPNKWTSEQYQLIGEFIRRNHARLAHEIALFGVPGPSTRKVELVDEDPQLLNLAGLVARSHGVDIRSCLDYLSSEFHPRDFRGVHAVFLMAVLRVADYLQVQSSRAPEEILKVRSLRSPTSKREWNVHHAIRNITYNEPDPEAVRIQIHHDRTDLLTFLRLQEWLDGIQSELDTSWAVLGEVYGRYSENQLSDLGLTIRRVRSDIDDVEDFASHVAYVPCSATFRTADAELLELLIKPLYGDRPEIGIRELIQNSVDAVLELNAYCYRHGIDRSQLERPKQDDEVMVALVLDDEQSRLIVSDAGIGMTVSTVLDYFLRAGASFRRSDFWEKEFRDKSGHSIILKSGRFGVGALASFLLGSEITVTTRHVSQSEWGVQFQASLGSEAMEIRRKRCPVGTTVSVLLSEKTVDQLIGKSSYHDYDIAWSVNYYVGRWDWYCLESPRVSRKIFGASTKPQIHRRSSAKKPPDESIIVEGASKPLLQSLQQRHVLPHGKAILKPSWHRISSRQYEDIQWTYVSAPRLVCNGIRVIDESRSSQWSESSFKCPNVSVFDPDGYFPLTLTRNEMATKALPFQKALFRDIVRDFLAYCLVCAPTEPIWGPGRKCQPQIAYPGCNRLGDVCWLQTKHGLGAMDSFNVYEAGIYTIICHDFRRDVEIPEWVKHCRDLPQVSLNTRGKRSIVRRVFYDWARCRTGEGCQDVKCRGTRFMIPTWEAEVWVQKWGLRADFRSLITTEWRTADWTIWRVGKCDESDLLKRIAKDARPSRSDAPITVAEKYVQKIPPESLSVIGEAWKEYIGVPIIPFDKSKRRRVLRNSFERLRKYVEGWEKQSDSE